jgi:hypothetical protein
MITLGIVVGVLLVGLAFALSRWITVTGELGPERREVRVKYLSFTFRIPSGKEADGKSSRDRSDDADGEPTKKEAKKKRGSSVDWLKLLPDGLQALQSGLIYLLRRLRIDNLRISGTVGTDDPADTGMLIGAIYAVYGALQPWSRPIELSVAPNFEEEVYAISLRGRVSVRLGVLIGMPLVVLWHLPKRRIWRTWRAQRRRRPSQQASRNARGTEVGI